MKFHVHEKMPAQTELQLESDPLRIWVTHNIELVIERGDRLNDVAIRIAEFLPVSFTEALGLATYYFNLGERYANQESLDPEWSTTVVNVERQYLTSGKKRPSKSKTGAKRGTRKRKASVKSIRGRSDKRSTR